MKKTLLIIAGLLIVTFAAGAAFVYSGQYNIAADEKHWPVTERVLELLRGRSVQTHARDIKVPDLDEPKLALKGARHYAEICVSCHLAPGVQNSALRQGLYPEPPDLSRNNLDPRSAFWITKHGMKMTGMPAWGARLDDETIWSLVAFLTKLPTLDAQQYQAMSAQPPPDEQSRRRGNIKGRSNSRNWKGAMAESRCVS